MVPSQPAGDRHGNTRPVQQSSPRKRSGREGGSPVAQSGVTSGSGTAATGASLTGASSSDGEIFFAGLATSTTMSTPSGYSALDASGSALHGSWFNSAASSTTIATTLGTSTAYGTIEIEVNHG